MRRVLLPLLGLVLAWLLGAAWYAYDRGLTSKWRGYVTGEFRKRGVELSLQRLTLDPVRGFIAKDVRVFDDKDRRRTLAVVDEMILQVNYANLIRDKSFLDAFELRAAKLSLPLDPAKPQARRIEITNLNARVFLPPEQIYLARAEAEIDGVRISASGRLIHPETFRSRQHASLPVELIETVLTQLEALKFEAQPPVISVTFTGDLAKPDKLFVEFALWGERVRRGKYLLKNLYVSASYRSGVLDVRQVIATDSAGEFRAAGLFEPKTKSAQFRLHSTLDAQALTRVFDDFAPLDAFELSAPPALDLRGELSFGERFAAKYLGHIELKNFTFQSIRFAGASADFSWNDGRWSAREIRLTRIGGEELTGDLMQLPTDFRARLTSTLDPAALRPLLSQKAAALLADFQFPHPPQLTLTARGAAPTLDSLTIEGDAHLGSATFRGIPAASDSATVRYENRVLEIAPKRAPAAEPTDTGTFRLDLSAI